MYVPKHFEETDLAVLHGLAQSRPFATWVVWANGELVVNHLPFLIHPNRGRLGTLAGHVARANSVWQAIGDETPSVAIFQGPQKYITPSWYPAKQVTGKVVPTWNYVVVHAHGSPRVIHDKDWLLAHVTELSDVHEQERPTPWKVSDAPRDYVDALVNAIVGIEIPLTALHGKWKLSQNRSTADLLGTISGLTADGDQESAEVATLANQIAQAKLQREQ